MTMSMGMMMAVRRRCRWWLDGFFGKARLSVREGFCAVILGRAVLAAWAYFLLLLSPHRGLNQ